MHDSNDPDMYDFFLRFVTDYFWQKGLNLKYNFLIGKYLGTMGTFNGRGMLYYSGTLLLKSFITLRE